jgi:5-formyltetrahydrofolate cyclo-ligase
MSERLRDIMRRNAKDMRAKLSRPEIQKRSRQVERQIEKLEVYRHAKNIALYISANGEVDLADIWQNAPFQGKFCYFPVLDDDKLIFLPATPKTPFEKNKFDILEPQVERTKAIAPADLDLVLMPLVVFDTFCQRLGMGKGYYDKTFAEVISDRNKSVSLIGVAYEFQKQIVLPTEFWDVPLDGVVSDVDVYWRCEK